MKLPILVQERDVGGYASVDDAETAVEAIIVHKRRVRVLRHRGLVLRPEVRTDAPFRGRFRRLLAPSAKRVNLLVPEVDDAQPIRRPAWP